MTQRLARRAPRNDCRRNERTRHAGRLTALEALESRRLWAAAGVEEVVRFEDVGVGGSSFFHVSTPLYVSVAPFGNSADVDNFDSYEEVYNQTFGPLRTQIAEEYSDELLGPLDVFGMPVMAGKTVVMDARPLNAEDPEDLGTMKTYVYSPGTPYNPLDDEENPGIVPTNLHVDLSYGNFERFTTVHPAGAPGPTLRHNPFIGPNPLLAIDPTLPPDSTPGVTIGHDGGTFTGSFLLDTGAVASMISQTSAEAVGVRYADDTYGTDEARLVDADGNTVPNQFTLTIGGIGGSFKAAGFFLDSMTLQTTEGSPIRYVGAPVLVADITVFDPETGDELTLDGIFGDNALVASAFIDENDPFPFPTDVTSGAYDWIVFDEPNGVLGLNVPGVDPSTTPVVEIEGIQPVALDMPRINALLRWTPDGEPMVVSEDGFESFNIQAFLDTGASGVLLSRETAEGLGVPNSTFAAPQGVVGRHVFYNNSVFDGGSAEVNAADDGAIAPDKDALLPGETATFDNVSTYARGINGVMIDVATLPDDVELRADDFTLRVGTSATASSWAPAATPTVTVRRGEGVNGTDRVTLSWPDGAVKNTWLQVTVHAGVRTGLDAPDVFYFGSLAGDTGNDPAELRVNALDVAAIKANLTRPSTLTGRFDFNRDGKTNALDLAAVKANLTRTIPLFAAPPAPDGGAATATGITSLLRQE